MPFRRRSQSAYPAVVTIEHKPQRFLHGGQTAPAGLKLILKLAPSPILMRRARKSASKPRERTTARSGAGENSSGICSNERIPSSVNGLSHIGHVNTDSSPTSPQAVVSNFPRAGADENSTSAR